MRVFTRREGEAVVIDGGITVRMVRMQGQKVRLGIEAPKDSRILRQELERRVLARSAEGAGKRPA